VLNSGPGQLKRLRALHQCARELLTLDPQDAHGLPQAVRVGADVRLCVRVCMCRGWGRGRGGVACEYGR
jgi:hypothetical protein